MASTAIDVEGNRRSASLKETNEKGITSNTSPESASVRSVAPGDNTHRTLKSRHIQLIGMPHQTSVVTT